MNKHTRTQLAQMQSLPLDLKVKMTQRRIQEWYDHYDGDVCVSFSGGKDSTALLDICRKMYPDIKAVYFNTGLEFPSIVKFVKTFDNVEIIKPQYTFVEVIQKYGYPLVTKQASRSIYCARGYIDKRRKRYEMLSKHIGGGMRNTDLCYIAASEDNSQYCSMMIGVYGRKYDKEKQTYEKNRSIFNYNKWLFMLDAPFIVSEQCCNYLKKELGHSYTKDTNIKMMTASLASESILRTAKWLEHGCNYYDGEHPISNPMSFWTEQDVLKYLHTNGIPIADIYGEVAIKGVKKPTYYTTGLERTGCFSCGYGMHVEAKSRLKKMIEIGEGRLVDWMLRGGDFEPESGLWKPKGGLGMYFCFEWMNRAGGLNIWIPEKKKYHAQLPEKAREILDGLERWQWNPKLWEIYQNKYGKSEADEQI